MVDMLRKLFHELDFKLSEVFQVDLFVGALIAVGALVLSLNDPGAVIQSVPIMASLVGVVIGAVIAGAALLAAFLDQPFLRKIRAINKNPVRYLSPFLFTAVLGVAASISLVVMSTLSRDSNVALFATTATVTAFFSAWTIASLLPCLSTLVQFIHLKMDALDVDDQIGKGKQS
ncbi:hypothetical protein [Pseudonocardia alni]|uniref:hypothetical protein n=1 Tax=Pseudonocardia alni TaxID=33907 RepID=UPI001AD75B4D|nr:hypothetical protein [Pseudonocardia alni]MBO4239013.1 hypothetical protein [Pseudonocardia alni]WFG42734.1 hypothetical protein PaSha_03900 [Pseudonocardia alni]